MYLVKCEKILEKKENIPVFGSLLDSINDISNLDYQKKIWIKYEDLSIVDSYDDTTMYFFEDGDALIEAYEAGRVEMSDKQYQMLKTLYQMVDEYDDLMDRPETDEGIVNDPRWSKVGEYAKLVYEELKKS